MIYTVFNIEKNKKEFEYHLSMYSGDKRRLADMIWSNELETRTIANQRHNEAMLLKDIEIAGLRAKLEVYEKGLS